MTTPPPPMVSPDVRLREVRPADLDTLFEFHRDPVAVHMAAFTSEDPSDRGAFDAWWARLLASDTITRHTILADDEVVGSTMTWVMDGQREVTYGIGRPYWGRGIATTALRQLLEVVTERPLCARAAADNVGSLRVLDKCGFRVVGEERGFANARGEEIDEYVLILEDPAGP